MARVDFGHARRNGFRFEWTIDGGEDDGVACDVNEHPATRQVGDDFVFLSTKRDGVCGTEENHQEEFPHGYLSWRHRAVNGIESEETSILSKIGFGGRWGETIGSRAARVPVNYWKVKLKEKTERMDYGTSQTEKH